MSKANEAWPRNGIREGTAVMTTSGPKTWVGDWTEEAVKKRKWGVQGVVIDFSDAHGLCYQVRHDADGSTAYYDPAELIPLT